MHVDPDLTAPANDSHDSRPWYLTLTRYHWFVLLVAALGWLFDCLDQQLFVLARPAAMRELVVAKEDEQPKVTEQRRSAAGNLATSVFMAGWACGGLFFGVLGDRWGRARVMLVTILLYSAFTGLSAFSQNVYDFALYRFLTGLGVGGEFAVGVALVAEVMPGNARPYTLGLLQALSAVGNISAAFINLGLGLAEEQGLAYSPWRIMFCIGALPALLALVIRAKLKEPEQWQRASHDDAIAKKMGSYRELFRDPVWRRHALLGMVLGCSGIIGLWSVGFFVPDLIREVQRERITLSVLNEKKALATSDERARWDALIEKEEQHQPVPDSLKDLREEASPIINSRLTPWASYTSLMINIGGFFGMFGFGALSQKIGRRPALTIAFLAAFVSTSIVCWFLSEFWQIFVMVPIMGFCQLSLFAGYAIYFPELFPTRLRSTGTSFCYNVGRFVAALGPIVKSELERAFATTPQPLRYAGVTMCLVFLLGLVVLPFLPETRGKPLPE